MKSTKCSSASLEDLSTKSTRHPIRTYSPAAHLHLEVIFVRMIDCSHSLVLFLPFISLTNECMSGITLSSHLPLFFRSVYSVKKTNEILSIFLLFLSLSLTLTCLSARQEMSSIISTHLQSFKHNQSIRILSRDPLPLLLIKKSKSNQEKLFVFFCRLRFHIHHCLTR